MEQNTAVAERRLERWWALLIIMMAADAAVTMHIVQNGMASEGNPLLGWAVTHVWFVAVKMLGGLVVGWMLWRGGGKWQTRGIPMAALVMAGIVAWNLTVGVIA